MILDSFKVYSAIIQIQYADAFVLWDRAGEISRQLSKIWSGIRIADGQPNQQSLTGDGVKINTGISTATVTVYGEHALGHLKARQICETFDVWKKYLELDVLTRVSTRTVFLKDFNTIKKANAELISMELVKWPTSDVFDQPLDSDRNAVEVQFRFEDEASFSLLKLKSEQVKFKMEADSYWLEESEINKEKNRMVIDFDRGLLGSVNAEKFRMDEWIKGYQHVLRRDIEKVLKASR